MAVAADRSPDFFAPVRLSREEFEVLLDRLESSFRAGAAALVVDDTYPFREISVDWPNSVFSEAERETYIPVVPMMDHVLQFAMEEAPAAIVREWAQGYDEERVGEAIERVTSMRERMPYLTAAWDAKSNSPVPLLSTIRYDITAAGEDLAYVTLSLATVLSGVLGRADRSSRQIVTTRLWRNDLQRLHALLGGMLETLNEHDREARR
jgi:hypothetical protein